MTAARATRAPSAKDLEIARLRAEQAELLIENVRLSAGRHDAHAALREALEQQAASGEIARSVGDGLGLGDLPATLHHIAATAGRLCGADGFSVFLERGDGLASATVDPGGAPTFRVAEGDEYARWREQRTWATARSMLERRTIHVPDLEAAPDHELAFSKRTGRRIGHRALLVVPLLHEDTAIGALSVRRVAPGPFTDQQIALLESLAGYAAVAAAGARLVDQLKDRTTALQEALDQQTATAEVLQTISRSPTELQTVLDTIAESAARLCDAERAGIAQVRGDGAQIVAATADWLSEDTRRITLAEPFASGPVTRTASTYGRAIAERTVVHVSDLAGLPVEELAAEGLRAAGVRSVLTVPLLHQATAIGAISLQRREVRPFTQRQIALIQTFADQAVIAIENSRLFAELQRSNQTLTEQKRQLQESLEQQEATAEVLRAISASPSNLRAVMDVIGETARRLCRADGVRTGIGPPSATWRGVMARARLERRTVHVHDVLAHPDEYPDAMPAYRRDGVRTIVAVPLLRDGHYLGAISATRRTVQPFTEREIALLETFADQAVIAVENARLFGELQERDERRRQELERAAAIQQRLLPSSIEAWPGVLEIAVRFRPAVETSGDFYDVLRLAPTTEGDLPALQIAVGDVAGKGMSAALVTALARSALQASAAVPPGMATPAATLRVAGRRLHRDVGNGHFVACALAVVEPPGVLNRGPLLRLSNAAQVPVLLCRDGAASEVVPPGDRLPLGARSDGAYKDAEIELRPGDVVVFSSDGLVEAPSLPTAAAPPHLPPPAEPGDLFGFDRLAASAAHWSTNSPTAEAVAAGIWNDLTAWCGNESHHDDMTLLVLRVPESGR